MAETLSITVAEVFEVETFIPKPIPKLRVNFYAPREEERRTQEHNVPTILARPPTVERALVTA